MVTKTTNKLKKNESTVLTDSLQVLLASENVLNLKIRNYHRNVVWQRFYSLHKYFEQLYTMSYEIIDEIAERIRILWCVATWTMKEYLDISFIEDDDKYWKSDKEMLDSLLQDYELLLKKLKEYIDIADDIDDDATEWFLVSILEKYEKIVWMLRSQLQ